LSLDGEAAPQALSSSPTRRSSDLRLRHRRGARPRARAGAAHAVHAADRGGAGDGGIRALHAAGFADFLRLLCRAAIRHPALAMRSEEHTSELQSRENLVCRLLLEK